jgi:hypothetical protein
MGRVPYPSINYFPKRLREEADPAIVALAGKIDSLTLAVQKEVLLESMWHDPARCPSQFLPELAYYVGATLLNTDTDSQKRSKIAYSVRNLRNLGLWDTDVKFLILAITGITPLIFADQSGDWPIRLGKDTGPSTYYWNVRGGGGFGNGLDPLDTGPIRTGTGSESIIPGNLFIDLGSSSLTAAVITQIIASIQPHTPPYIRVFLGYTVSGQFNYYANGQIN